MKGCYHYLESGLRSIWLKNGYAIKRDPDYGERVSIHDVDGLHRAIGRALANKPRLVCLEHTDGNTPIFATIRRINDLDERGSDRIIAEDAKGGWRTQAA